MKVSYESTVREMDAEELEAEYAVLEMKFKRTADIAKGCDIIALQELISNQYQQLTGKPLINGHLPTVL